MNRQAATSSRTQLVLIVVIALMSIGGAYLLFVIGSDGELWGTSNKGTFVDPPMQVAELGVRFEDGARFETGGIWWLWVVPRGPCDATCRQAVHQVRQVHVLLNRESNRVRRALVAAPQSTDAALLDRYPRLELLSGNLAQLQRGVYVVDPIGNLVLHYSLNDAGEPVLDDLKRLLKASQIG
jgi:hypothetical protein